MDRPRPRDRSIVLGAGPAVVAMAALAAGCAGRADLCAAPGSCGPGRICSAGRCVLPATDPVASDADRIVVAATDMAVVSARGGDDALPAEIALAGGCSPVVLLRFPAPWGNHARIAAAFLTLELADAAVAHARPLTLSVARVLEPWSGGAVTWSRLPRLSPPLLHAEVEPPPRMVRIDVTEIVRRWGRGRSDDQGIALWASSAGAAGPTYATGALGTAGPRLDVYVR